MSQEFRTALIIEDHPLFGDALAMTLQHVAGIGRVTQVERIGLALHYLSANPAPDVIVLDLNLPDVTGLEGLIKLRNGWSHVPVVVISSVDDGRVIRQAMSAGAAGFVPKHSPRELFRVAFETIARGEAFVPELAEENPSEQAENGSQDEALRRLSLLTRQQARILEEICEGKMNKQIAFDLEIAETTVKAHVTAIMRKLGVNSRTQAVLLVRQTQDASTLPEATSGR